MSEREGKDALPGGASSAAPSAVPTDSEEQFFHAAGGDRVPGPPTDDDPMGIEARELDKDRTRRTRYRFLVLAFLVLAGVLAWLLRDELVYFFRSSTPEDLGVVEEMETRPLAHNSHVRLTGVARDMCVRADLFSSQVRYLYLLGSEMGARILIQAPVGDEPGCLGAEDRSFTGRLLDLSVTGRYDGVVKFYREKFPYAPASPPLYILLEGEQPRQAWWYPAAFAVVLLMVGVNLRILWRGRPRQDGPETPSKGETA